MLVYSGKLKWYHYGVDETFAIVLPSSPVRVGDVAHLFSQWTVDSNGVEKANWSSHLTVSKVSKTESGDDTFTLPGSYYSWEITSQQAYGKLSATMSNPAQDKSTMALDRIWQSKGEQSVGTGRIWFGKINWSQFALNELAIFIVPEGFGEGKPVLSLWQWTRDSSGNKKSPSFRDAIQKQEAGTSSGVTFSYHSYYDLACAWDAKSEKLGVHMSEYGNTKDLGQFPLSAVIEGHSHDWNPPEAAPTKAELEVRLPQAQPSLTRILTPLPFPRTLIDTLAHTAAFVDQAGYLAKYAEERYRLLDADLHLRSQELNAANTENGELKDQLKKLTDDLNVEKVKVANLEAALNEARNQGINDKAALTKKINELEDLLRKGSDHDAEDHRALEAARKAFEAERVAKDDLQKRLDAALLALSAAEARLKTALSQISDLEARVIDLEAQLSVEKKRTEQLQAENSGLSKELNIVKAQLRQRDADLAFTQKELKQAKEDILEKDDEIEGIKKERKAAEDIRDHKELAFKNLKKKTDAAIEELEDKLRAAGLQ
ncbi:hypothetical protein G7Z17_g4539 [Cylindrodendrum hubeiense]|uniref:Uncharacterized protein n=1 Tax=Cylindrodendrum hubeiense TaxID=595255 RepID=A0A9P5LCJ9_9HYPO|nr:hypothetical protein G7Z17_g4539 [Cylindrodendrum hubeiense]